MIKMKASSIFCSLTTPTRFVSTKIMSQFVEFRPTLGVKLSFSQVTHSLILWIRPKRWIRSSCRWVIQSPVEISF